MTHKSPVNFRLIHFLLWTKGSHGSPNFDTFQCSGENLRNSSCHFPKHKLVFIQILHHSSGSWDIIPQYFFSWNLLYFQRKEPIKVQISWNLMWAFESLKLCTLMGSFCPNHVQFQHRRVISHETEEWEIWWIFTQPFKSPKIAFCPNYKGLSWKKYRWVIFHDIGQWYKILINLELVVSKLVWGIRWTFIKAHKSIKICILMGSFCPKHNNSARTFQRNFVSLHWKVMQNLKENWLVALKMT